MYNNSNPTTPGPFQPPQAAPICCARCGSADHLRLSPAKSPHWGRVDCDSCRKYVKFCNPAQAARNGLEMPDLQQGSFWVKDPEAEQAHIAIRPYFNGPVLGGDFSGGAV